MSTTKVSTSVSTNRGQTGKTLTNGNSVTVAEGSAKDRKSNGTTAASTTTTTLLKTIPTGVLTAKQEEALTAITQCILRPGKGVLAADDTNDGIGARLVECGMENTAENRRRYRQLLFTTPRLDEYISAVILYDDTYHQNTETGERFVDLLRRRGIVVGIQVDLGIVPLHGSSANETTAQGMLNLAQRCREYRQGGCEFAKWRCAYSIGDGTPSQLALQENANVLARYASICQAEGIVPFVELDVLCQESHDLTTCQRVTEQVLSYTYKALAEHNVFLEGTVLNTNLVTAGLDCSTKPTADQVAAATLTTLRRSVPAAVPGVAFLSGGIDELAATEYLNALNRAANGGSGDDVDGERSAQKPWRLTFCYGRALQSRSMQVWAGQGENVIEVQRLLLHRAKANGDAERGAYAGEKAVANSIFFPGEKREKIGIYY